MKALIAIDHHFLRTASGEVFLGPPMSIPGYAFWERYLAVFDEVLVPARVRNVKMVASSSPPCDGPGVVFHGLPDYTGPWEYLACRRKLKAEVERAVGQCDAYILRVPGTIGQLAWKSIRRLGRPFAVEVVADPWDILSPGATRSVVRPWVRRKWTSELRQMCAEAAAALYVTRGALQQRYPPGAQTWATSASDVELASGVANDRELRGRMDRLARCFSKDATGSSPLRIGFLGSLAQMYKAPDVLLRAAAVCIRTGLNIEAELAGDGKFRKSLENLAVTLGIAGRVRFLGALTPGEPVFQFLDSIDLFLLPSLQEGLPRAMVEAMSRGCPCIGSTVGGIPELLPVEDLVAPGDVHALAVKIRDVASDLPRMERMSRRNQAKAREYDSRLLTQTRSEFYGVVRERAGRPGFDTGVRGERSAARTGRLA